METMINEKIGLLYDFCILIKQKQESDTRGRKKYLPDARETQIRNYLANCKTEIQLEQVMLPVLVGRQNINTWLGEN